MPSTVELLRVLLLPLVVSAIIAGIGRWRMWAWAMPLAAGVGFIVGYAAHVGLSTEKLFGFPGLPPADGTDWLFWLAIPLTIFGVLDAYLFRGVGWLLGLAAGAISLCIAWPLVNSGSATWGTALALAGGFGAVGALMALVTRVARPALGSWAVGIVLACTLGAAAVVVMSSGLRAVGVYGIAAAAAMGPAAVLIPRKGRGVTVVCFGLLAGLLTGGRLYSDEGVSWLNLIVITLAPLLLLPAAFLPIKPTILRGAIATALILAVLGLVTVPTAIKAKHAAEDDPYGATPSGY